MEFASSTLPDANGGESSTINVSELLCWKDKCYRLENDLARLQLINHNLEDRMLSMIEKSESDKLVLSNEIDEMAAQLQSYRSTVNHLVSENTKYKSDCMVAVHLLQCQPSSYVAHNKGDFQTELQKRLNNAEEHDKQSSSNNNNNAMPMHVCSFPPTAMVFSGGTTATTGGNHPDDPVIDDEIIEHKIERHRTTDSTTETDSFLLGHHNFKSSLRSASTPHGLHELSGATEDKDDDTYANVFVQKILAEPAYSNTNKLHQCSKCGRIDLRANKSTQTTGISLDYVSEYSDSIASVHVQSRSEYLSKPFETKLTLENN